MEDPNYDLFQYRSNASEVDDMSMVLPNPPHNLSLTGLLAQRRRQSLSTRMIKRSQLSPPQSPNITTNPNAPLPQAIPRATQTSPSASPTSSPSTSPGQIAYRQTQVFYNQMHLRLNHLRIELITEFQNRERCRRNPSRSQPRETFASLFEKQQEIALLQERITSMAQSIQDLNENEDGMWDAASLGCVGEEEAAAEAEEWIRSRLTNEEIDEADAASLGGVGEEEAAAEAEEWIRGRLTNREVNEAIAEAWREVYPERELGW